MTWPHPVEERPAAGPVPLHPHPGWAERFRWLVQGTTGRGAGEEEFDLGLFGAQPVGEALARWRLLRDATEAQTVVHSRQVHRSELLVHGEALPPGLMIVDGFDGHVSHVPGLLLAVSVADCVPAFVVDAGRRVVALAHAGWRGVAGGIVERALKLLMDRGSRAEDLWIHYGPAICGACYEVGPEVHAAVHPDVPPPPHPAPIDLRAALAERAAVSGVPRAQISVSRHCTRCGPGAFFSHRAGSPRRQMGVLGIRA